MVVLNGIGSPQSIGWTALERIAVESANGFHRCTAVSCCAPRPVLQVELLPGQLDVKLDPLAQVRERGLSVIRHTYQLVPCTYVWCLLCTPVPWRSPPGRGYIVHEPTHPHLYTLPYAPAVPGAWQRAGGLGCCGPQALPTNSMEFLQIHAPKQVVLDPFPTSEKRLPLEQAR